MLVITVDDKKWGFTVRSAQTWKKHLVTLLLVAFGVALMGCASEAPSIHELIKMQNQSGGSSNSQGAEGYVLRPKDTIEVRVWREPDLSGTRLIRRDGSITMPLIGDVQAAGKTTNQLKQDLDQRLKVYISTPEVSVSLLNSQPPIVYVSGEVKSPGEYEIQEGGRIVQALTKAGGFTEWAKKSKVILIRRIDGKEMRFQVNYEDIISGKDPKQNVPLKDGDVIVVR